MLTLDALKDLYVAAGGSASAVANASTNVEVLNAIAVLNGGDGGSVLIPDAVEDIADHYSGGGGGDITTVKISVRNAASTSAALSIPTFDDDLGSATFVTPVINPGPAKDIDVILYNGSAVGVISTLPSGATASGTGGVSFTSATEFKVTGTGSIVISS